MMDDVASGADLEWVWGLKSRIDIAMENGYRTSEFSQKKL